jgi:hypothetical protein
VPMDTADKGTHKVYFDVVAVDDANLQLHEKAVFLVR